MYTQNQVAVLEKRITELEKENLLPENVVFLTRNLYSSPTEQASSLGIEGQMALFDKAETSADPSAMEPDLKDVTSYQRQKFRDPYEELLKNFPHASSYHSAFLYVCVYGSLGHPSEV